VPEQTVARPRDVEAVVPRSSAVIEVVEECRDEEVPHLARSELVTVEYASVVAQVEHVAHVPEVVVRVVHVRRVEKHGAKVVNQVPQVEVPVIPHDRVNVTSGLQRMSHHFSPSGVVVWRW